MDDLSLTLEESPRPEEVAILESGLNQYNLSYIRRNDYQPLAVFLRDAAGEVVGGASGGTYWGWLYIQYLWVAEEYRSGGYGRRLMAAAHQEAVRRGCERCHLDTLDFQALPFYEKLGYEVFGVLEDCPPGHRRYFLQNRKLAGPAAAPALSTTPSPSP